MVKLLSISLILLAIIAITYGRSTEYNVAINQHNSLHLNIGANANSEDDNTSEGNTGGDGNTSEDNTGEGNTSEGNTGEGNTAEDNTGEDNTGEGNTDGVENLQGVIKNLKEEFKSELESAINAAKSELKSAIEASNDDIAKNAASIQTSNDVMNNLKEKFNATKSELKSAIEASNDDIAKNAASIQTSNGEIAKNAASIQTSDDGTVEADYKLQRILLNEDIRVKVCGNLRSPSKIGDDQLTASSSWKVEGNKHHPNHGRLYSTSGDGGWHVGNDMLDYEWIQVDMGRNERFYGVATQGRYNYDQWVTSYKVQYKEDDDVDFHYVVDDSGEVVIFRGNTDQSTVVINNFQEPINARYLRIQPLVAASISWTGALCLRFDVLTC